MTEFCSAYLISLNKQWRPCLSPHAALPTSEAQDGVLVCDGVVLYLPHKPEHRGLSVTVCRST
jgi:hypothetical protein